MFFGPSNTPSLRKQQAGLCVVEGFGGVSGGDLNMREMSISISGVMPGLTAIEFGAVIRSQEAK